ncbi:unnamed protein product [Acanthosepion pharaonis]|uniref:Uncharacterized protein n=1 Tax=Acanthosepion pharaonis TaxID=158019 RepID=A0A812BHX0_ACAPH|nr:unnamed protein product [Sepia pharaonis]
MVCFFFSSLCHANTCPNLSLFILCQLLSNQFCLPLATSLSNSVSLSHSLFAHPQTLLFPPLTLCLFLYLVLMHLFLVVSLLHRLLPSLSFNLSHSLSISYSLPSFSAVLAFFVFLTYGYSLILPLFLSLTFLLSFSPFSYSPSAPFFILSLSLDFPLSLSSPIHRLFFFSFSTLFLSDSFSHTFTLSSFNPLSLHNLSLYILLSLSMFLSIHTTLSIA